MSMSHHGNIGKVRFIIVLCCLALIAGIVGYAYVMSNKEADVLAKNEIEAKLEEYRNRDLGYTYTSSYVKKYGVGNINSYKINSVETQLKSEFYKELPAGYTLAESICNAFLEKYYDVTDLSDKEAVTDAVLKCYFESIGDAYAYYRTSSEFEEYMSSLEGDESFVGIGVLIDATTLEVISVYRDSGAYEAGMRSGDVIYGVDGKTQDDTDVSELANLLKGEVDTTVKVTVKRGDELIDMVVTRRLLTERTVNYEIDDDKVGYIYISQFLETTYEQFVEAVDFCTEEGAVALVIDVRGNPGGLVDSVSAVIDYLVPDAQDRMICCYTHGGIEYTYYTTDGHGVDVPISVICNKYTASAGELFTAAMRDFNDSGAIKATVVGENTYGKGVVQTSYALYDMSGITFTVGYYNPPCNVNFDGMGVAPDITVEEILGEDKPFEQAKKAALDLVYTGTDAIAIYGKAA